MRFSYEWLKNIVGFNQSLNEVVDLLNRYSFDTEPAGKTSIEVKLPPNRIGDASGHLGLAKEVAVVLGKTIDLPKMTYRAASFKTSDFLSVEIKNKNRCPRYLAMYAELNRVGRSPKWMQKRMQDCGLRPINAVVDIMNYVMLEYGQPLHAFDFDKLDRGQAGKKQIIVRLAQKGEMIATIEDKTYKLVGTELLICDSKQPLAIAGIKGGKDAEIDFQTKKIVVEAANFDPIGIRQAARSLGIRTDASARFENGVDPNLAGKAMQRVCALLQEICGAKVAKNGVDIYPVKKLPKKLIVSLTAIEKILGMKVSAKQAETIFKSFCVSSKKIYGGK
jgi:phenylalanyl-tRNA synthetase beta chain